MNKPMTHLFLFTIGPVQGFIAQARKTMDLKAGSDILSQLILAGMKVARDQYSVEIIFPHLPQNGDAASMPNKFLAQVEIGPDKAREMGIAIEAEVRLHFRNIASQALKKMGLEKSGEVFRQKFFDQIEKHLEVYWVFEPVDGAEDYFRAYQEIEQNLGSIKNLRAFKQLPVGEDGRKCSVSGERDALVFGDRYKLPAFAYKNRIEQIKKSPVLIGKGEGLSAVVATKRFAMGGSFYSAAQIATLAFENQLQGTKTNTLFTIYRGLFASSDWDGQLLFDENLSDKYLKENLTASHKARSNQEVRRQLGALIRQAKEEKVPSITSYYALLTFDGDRMGATWSGDKEFLRDASQLKAFQQALAERLYAFAGKAKTYLNLGKGQTVYAGGDDFTGFVNLHYLFEVLEHLRNLYQTEVSDQLREYLKPEKELTFSAGICIAHYKNPLGEVVRSAHKAQDYAKEEGGRDAFAIYLMKRSGEIQQATMKWGKDLENLKALQTCTKLMQQGCFSNTFINVLNQEIMSLVGRGKTFDTKHDFQEILELEIKRLIRQSKIDKGIKTYLDNHSGRKSETIISDMQKATLTIFQAKRDHNVENFLHWLEISDFLNRQPDHAN